MSFSDRAVDALKARKTKVQSWYLDLSMVQSYWGGDRAYHHTAPITMIYALREGLRLVLEEGLEARWARHLRNHLALKAGSDGAGAGVHGRPEGHQLPQLNAVPHSRPAWTTWPGGSGCSTEFGIEVGGGLGDFKGKAWRIGLMGYNSRPELRVPGAGGPGNGPRGRRPEAPAGCGHRRRRTGLRRGLRTLR